MNWLLRWQHLAPGTQLFGEHGTLEAVRQIGIVFRELLACESILPKWRELLMILRDRKSTRLNSSHVSISYAVFCLKKKKKKKRTNIINKKKKQKKKNTIRQKNT